MSTLIASNAAPISIYLPAASDTGNSFVQSATTYLPAPATFVGNLTVVPSTATAPSAVYISATLESSYNWNQYNPPGYPLTYFIEPALSG